MHLCSLVECSKTLQPKGYWSNRYIPSQVVQGVGRLRRGGGTIITVATYAMQSTSTTMVIVHNHSLLNSRRFVISRLRFFCYSSYVVPRVGVTILTPTYCQCLATGVYDVYHTTYGCHTHSKNRKIRGITKKAPQPAIKSTTTGMMRLRQRLQQQQHGNICFGNRKRQSLERFGGV